MKIEGYISVMVVLAVGLFFVSASWPEATFGAVQASTDVNCVPVNTWCTPATAGGVSGTFCTTEPVRPASRGATSAETLGEAIGSVLALPFVVTECLLVGCP